MDSAGKITNTLSVIKERPALQVHQRSVRLPRQREGASFRIFDFLQEGFSRLRRSELDDREAAGLMLDCLDEIVRRETGAFSFESGSAAFLSAFAAEAAISEAARMLHRKLTDFTADTFTGDKLPGRSAVISDFQEFILWYAERKISLDKLRQLHTVRPEGAFFDLQIFHDQNRDGAAGMEVRSSFILNGFAGQYLWHKIYIKNNDEYVTVRPGWESWIDDTDVLLVQESTAPAVFCVLTPLIPALNTQVIDQTVAFVPYAALSLTAAHRELEIEVMVADERGRPLLQAGKDEQVSGAVFSAKTRPFLSGQAIGIWPQDIATRTGISELKASCGLMTGGVSADDMIGITFDLDVRGCAGETLTVEVRFLTEEGNLVEQVYGPRDEKNEGFVFRQTIQIDRPIKKFRSFQIAVPADVLEIDYDTMNLVCEVTLLSGMNKVLCGAASPFEYIKSFRAVRPRPESSVPAFVSNFSPCTGADCEIHSELCFISEEITRLKLHLSCSDLARRGYRGDLVVSIENREGLTLSDSLNGEKPLVQCLQFMPGPAGEDLTFIFHVDRTEAGRGLVCCVRALLPEGQTAFTIKKPLLPLIGAENSLDIGPSRSPLAEIIDLVIPAAGLHAGERIEAVLNIAPGAPDEEYVLYYESSGNSQRPASSRADRPFFLSPVPVPRDGCGSGSFQIRHILNLKDIVKSGGLDMHFQVKLFSSRDGSVIQEASLVSGCSMRPPEHPPARIREKLGKIFSAVRR